MPAKGVSIVSARTELVVVGGGVVGLAIARQAARADPERMAVAMRHAVVAGRCAWLAGRIPRRWHAQASSPVDGLLERR
jgi:thiazole synthase